MGMYTDIFTSSQSWVLLWNQWRDIRVAGLFSGHFRTLSQLCEIQPWCQSRNGAESDSASPSVSASALFSATQQLGSSPAGPPAARKDHQSYNLPLHNSSMFPLTQPSVTWRGSTEPSDSFFPKGCQQSHTGIFLI